MPRLEPWINRGKGSRTTSLVAYRLRFERIFNHSTGIESKYVCCTWSRRVKGGSGFTCTTRDGKNVSYPIIFDYQRYALSFRSRGNDKLPCVITMIRAQNSPANLLISNDTERKSRAGLLPRMWRRNTPRRSRPFRIDLSSKKVDRAPIVRITKEFLGRCCNKIQ